MKAISPDWRRFRESLRRGLRIFWPKKIRNNDLYCRTEIYPVGEMIKCRRWRWIGHILWKLLSNNYKVILTSTPEGKRDVAYEQHDDAVQKPTEKNWRGKDGTKMQQQQRTKDG